MRHFLYEIWVLFQMRYPNLFNETDWCYTWYGSIGYLIDGVECLW